MDKMQYRFCVAPLMDGTDRHCRYFHRLLSKKARLYTEMLTADAVIHGDRDRLLGFSPQEHPVALQLGGSNPALLAEAARIGQEWGYDEINLNVGCPSDRVQSGTFGACLMKTPQLVAQCVGVMRAATSLPVTVKCRIGVDDQDPRESLFTLVEMAKAEGCDTFIVHARKAWLQGLSPKENREVPPLDYALVAALKEENPDLTIVLNGGITTLDQCKEHLKTFDGVMLGRAAYGEPYLLSQVDCQLFGRDAEYMLPLSREAVVEEMALYMDRMVPAGCRPNHIVRHMIGLYHARPGARLWRRLLSEQGSMTPPDILRTALAQMAAINAEPADA